MNDELIYNISKKSLRLILGAMFVTAAILKLLSIDYFEIYVYSFNLFSFELATILSRVLISCEILLGLGLIFKVFYKKVWWLSMLMMIGFSIFLLYVIVFRNDDNCHCFGELIRLNPSESIIKNIITILLLLVVKKETNNNYKPRFKKWLIGISVTVSVILPFVVFPTDILYNKLVSKDGNINTSAFERSLNDSINIIHLKILTENDSLVIHRDSLTKFDVTNDKYIISYISAGCEFCKMGAQKLMMIMNHNELDYEHIIFMVWGYDVDILKFIQETETKNCDYWFINPMISIDITNGKFPFYVWTNKGFIVNYGDLRDLSESMISDFLQ